MEYRVIIEPDEDGVFCASVPALPGCVSDGKTRAEAIENIKEAVMAYLESLEKSGDPIPAPLTDHDIVEIDPSSLNPKTGAA